jgi:dCMP deaminase
MKTWDEYFMEMAALVATKSKDPNTQHGAVIVGPNNEVRSTGFNGFPRGVIDNARYNVRPLKYFYVEHAERNAIYNAARHGTALEGCTMYVTGCPCHDCARGIIQSGIKRVVMAKGSAEFNERWKESMEHTMVMFDEADIDVEEV